MKNPYRLLLSLLIFVLLTVGIYYALVFLRPVFGIHVCEPVKQIPGMMVLSDCFYRDIDLVYLLGQFFVSPVIALVVSIIGYKLLGRKKK